MHEIPKTLENSVLMCKDRSQKIGYLMKLIEVKKDKKVIIFFNTKASVHFYYKIISEYINDRPSKYGDLNIDYIHGEIKQQKRLNTFNRFLESESGLLFATDVISRGIDFPAVDYIFQIDPPQNPSSYIHRIGRTARKGQKGQVFYLANSRQSYF